MTVPPWIKSQTPSDDEYLNPKKPKTTSADSFLQGALTGSVLKGSTSDQTKGPRIDAVRAAPREPGRSPAPKKSPPISIDISQADSRRPDLTPSQFGALGGNPNDYAGVQDKLHALPFTAGQPVQSKGSGIDGGELFRDLAADQDRRYFGQTPQVWQQALGAGLGGATAMGLGGLLAPSAAAGAGAGTGALTASEAGIGRGATQPGSMLPPEPLGAVPQEPMGGTGVGPVPSEPMSGAVRTPNGVSAAPDATMNMRAPTPTLTQPPMSQATQPPVSPPGQFGPQGSTPRLPSENWYDASTSVQPSPLSFPGRAAGEGLSQSFKTPSNMLDLTDPQLYPEPTMTQAPGGAPTASQAGLGQAQSPGALANADALAGRVLRDPRLLAAALATGMVGGAAGFTAAAHPKLGGARSAQAADMGGPSPSATPAPYATERPTLTPDEIHQFSAEDVARGLAEVDGIDFDGLGDKARTAYIKEALTHLRKAAGGTMKGSVLRK